MALSLEEIHESEKDRIRVPKLIKKKTLSPWEKLEDVNAKNSNKTVTNKPLDYESDDALSDPLEVQIATEINNNLTADYSTARSPLLDNEKDSLSVTEPEHNRNKSVIEAQIIRNRPVTKQKQNRNKSVTQSVTKQKQNRIKQRNRTVTRIGDMVHALHGNELQLMRYLVNHCSNNGNRITAPLSYSKIFYDNNMKSTEVVRITIYRLIQKEFLSKYAYKNGKGGWVQFEIPDPIYKEFKHSIDKITVTVPEQYRNTERNNTVTQSVTNPLSSSSLSLNNIKKTTTTSTDEQTNIFDLPSDWLDINLPEITKLTENHLTQLYKKGLFSSRDVQESINAFAFDLEHNNKSNSIKGDQISYFMGTMRRNGGYLPPSNYESPKEIYLKQFIALKQKETDRLTELEEKAFEISYVNWSLKAKRSDKIKLLDIPVEQYIETPFLDKTLRSIYREKVWVLERDAIFDPTLKKAEE